MNDAQRNEIQRLRQAGMGYVKIAQTLMLSANTVNRNQEKYLFFEHNPEYGQKVPGRWFVERKEV